MALSPIPALRGVAPYSVKPPADSATAPDLILSGNEGARPDLALLADLATPALLETLRRYPDASALEALLAERLGVTPEQVLCTCGADDALDRACRAFLGPGRGLLVPTPSFEMLARYATITGAYLLQPPWPGPRYPTEAVLKALEGADTTVGVIAVVSPNNPTGAVAEVEDLCQLHEAAAARGALLLLDHAYIEFADSTFDLSRAALALPGALLVRTLSKAYGLAGLRVGYVAGHRDLIRVLRAAGAPYPISGLSLLLAERRLRANPAERDPALQTFIAAVQKERQDLQALLQRPEHQRQVKAVHDSQANFVLGRFTDAQQVHAALLRQGIAVRAFASAGLQDALRITCPGEPSAFARLTQALTSALEARP